LKGLQYIKDRTKALMIFPCRKKKCKLKHKRIGLIFL
jgi:hypothetical protein